MKACFKCRELKPLSEFYKNSKMGDGHFNKCKECSKTDVKKNRKDNVEHYRQYDKSRGTRQESQYVKEWRESKPKAYRAHLAVTGAIRNGRMKRLVCEVCGSVESHAHHDDYDYPLTVRFLCAPHHTQWHQENGEGLNAK